MAPSPLEQASTSILLRYPERVGLMAEPDGARPVRHAEVYGPWVVLGAASSHGTGASVPRNPEENRAVDWSGRQDLKM